jgi:hypothetical protein
LRDFAVSEDALTAAESASKPPWGLTVQPNSDFDEADLFDEAYLQVDSNRRLLGLAVAYREDQLKLVAAYSDGKRQGVAILWTAEGQLWYCARYARGHHEGYCCLFRAGEPIAVCEHASDQLITLHLIAERKARKSLNRSEHVLGDEEAKQVQLEIASAESELEAIERAFKGIASGIQQQAKPKIQQQAKPKIQQQAKPKIQEQTKPKNQQAAAKASVARRRNTIDRMNQRARSQKAALENLLRAKGF